MSKTIISRMQQKRGLRRDLPQPLRPGEIALTGDTGQVWIGNDADSPPFGVRTYDSGVSITDINTLLANNIVSVQFVGALSEPLVQELTDWLRPTNVNLFPTAPVFYNNTRQLLWDNNLFLFFGLRDSEIASAATIDADWNTDPAAAFLTLLADFPGFGQLPAVNQAQMLEDLFQPTWQGQNVFVRNFSNAQAGSAASGNAAKLINLTASPTQNALEWVTTLTNLEIGTVDVAQATLFPPDQVFLGFFTASLTAQNNWTPTGIEFPQAVSNSIFLEYTLRGGTYSASGKLTVTGNSQNTAASSDQRMILTPGLVGDVLLRAQQVGNLIEIQYQNTLSPTTVVGIKAIARRWNNVP